MVIRSIREHVATHNWFAVGIDLAIVVAGVFLGTQVSNLNEERIEGEQSASYRARLIDELDFNGRQYRQQIAYYRQVREHGLAALSGLKRTTSQSPQDFLIDAYQTSQVDSNPAKTFIYDEMVSAGLVDRLGDETIENVASDYYLTLTANVELFNNVFPYRTIIREIIPYAVQEEIRTRCGDRFVFHEGRAIGVRLVEPCNITLDAAAVAQGDAIVRGEPRLERELTRYLASIDEKLTILKAHLRLTADFRNKLIAAARAG